MANECKNCDGPVLEGQQFCPACGQRTQIHRFGLHDLAHVLVHYFTHADKGLFTLLRDLALRGGAVAREFLDGKRRKHFSPLNFYLIVAAVLVFIMSFQPVPDAGNVLKDHPQLSGIENPELRAVAIAQMERRAMAILMLNRYANLLAMAALPLTALAMWLFFRKRGYSLTEHLVAGMYMLGFCLLLYAVLVVPMCTIAGLRDDAGKGVLFMIQLVYYTIFYIGMFRLKGLARGRALLAAVTSLLLWIVFSAGSVYLFIRDGFFGIF